MKLRTASAEGEERCAAALQGQQTLQGQLQEQTQVGPPSICQDLPVMLPFGIAQVTMHALQTQTETVQLLKAGDCTALPHR